MKPLLLMTLFALLVHTGWAQHKINVLLKNGSVFTGKVVESESPDVVKIKSGSNLMVFAKADIDTFFYRRLRSTPVQFEVPWFFKVEGGILTGSSGNEENSPRFFQGTFNYGLTGKLFTGGGTGVEYYMEQTYIPAFANVEYKFRQTGFSPHFFLKTGYLFPGEVQQPSDLYDNNESRNLPLKYLKASGGFLLNPGFGFTSMLGQNIGFSLAAGYRHHVLRYSGKDKYEIEQHYNRISISLGLIFN